MVKYNVGFYFSSSAVNYNTIINVISSNTDKLYKSVGTQNKVSVVYTQPVDCFDVISYSKKSRLKYFKNMYVFV